MPGFDEKENEIKYRVRDPGMFEEGAYRTKDVGDGVQLILGKKSDNGSMIVQSIRFKKPQFTVETAKKWIADRKDSFELEPAKLYNIDSVEIFSTGKWNGNSIDKKILTQIVEAWSKTKGRIRPYLKLGHEDDQKILQSAGLPAAGWVDNLRISGEKLIADFVDVPKTIYQLIKNKAYRKVSCEIYNNVDFEGFKLPKLLGGVALLGSELPGVLNLNDILSLYAKESDFSKTTFAGERDVDIINLYRTDLEEKKMSDKDLTELQTKNKELEDKVSAFEAEKEKYSKLEEEIKQLEEKLAAVELEKTQTEIDKFVTELKSEKLCSPAMEGMVKELLGPEKEEYSIDKKQFSKKELLKEVFKLAFEAAKVNTEEKTTNEPVKKDESEAIEKYMSENKCDYSTAYRAIHKNDKE